MTFGGLPTRWEPAGASRGLALVAPGRAYPPTAPLLDFARVALQQHGFTVQQLWWDSTTRGDENPERWVRRHVAAALAEEDADHGMAVPGDAVRTAEIHLEVARAVEAFLSQV